MARIDITTRIAAPPDRCFDLSRSVELHTRSAATTGEIAIAGRTSGLLELGDEVTWQGRHFGLRQTLTSRITAYERPAHFRDSMVRGAFEFAAPYGLLGRVVERLLLAPYLHRFLVARNRTIKAIAESDAWKAFVEPA